MKHKLILIVVLMFEIVLCFIFCLSKKITKYNSWVQTKAVVNDVDYYEKSRVPAKNKNKNYYVVFIDYANLSKHIRFADYKPDFKENDEIIVKYNPNNPENVVYIPYEEHCVAVKKRNTILSFLTAIVITIVMFIANRKKSNTDIR
jgi:hypothetical protein